MFKEVLIQNGTVGAPAPPLTVLSWWPSGDFEGFRHREQENRLDWPVAGTAHSFSLERPGVSAHKDAHRITLASLWSLREAPGRQYHLLRAAVLHRWVGNSRCQWPEYLEGAWPARAEVAALYRRALDHAGFTDRPWGCQHVYCLPDLPSSAQRNLSMDEQVLATVGAFSDAVDVQVLLFLQHWTAVLLQYGRQGDQLLVARIQSDRERRRAETAAQAEAWRLRTEALRAAHPRWGEWPVAPAELRQLVWSKPLRDVARDFGVSDVAVKKACKTRGIDTPPRGYWLATERRGA